MKPVVRLVRAIHFSCGHSYAMEGVSREENKRAYGSLFHDGGGFGHNFKLEAYFEGEIDPLTGMIENLTAIDRWLKEAVGPLDHLYLNRDIEFFRQSPPTAENIARYCFEKIRKESASSRAKLVQVRLYEGDTTWIDVSNT